MIILLDNGHGKETLGKRSPDGKVMEWEYTRRLAIAVAGELLAAGYMVHFVTPEDEDVNLKKRVDRVNEICKEYGSRNCMLVSIHLNAAGFGTEWKQASGWSVYVSNNASHKSMLLAECLFDEAAKHFKTRKPDVFVKHWSQNLAICRDTHCAAVLTENLFMDNKQDVEALMDETMFIQLVKLHVDGIIRYIDEVV